MKNFISFFNEYELIIDGDYGLKTQEFTQLEEIFNQFNKKYDYSAVFNLDVHLFFNVTKTNRL